MLALAGDIRDEAYEILLSFASLEDKNEFLCLVSTNSDLGCSYIEDDITVPTAAEIRNARPLAMLLPNDVLLPVSLVATSLLDGVEHLSLDS